MSSLPFIDLQAQRHHLGDRIDRAIAGVLSHGAYLNGPEVTQLEEKLAEFCGARHALACSSGTDGLAMALMVLGVKPGDAVLVPAFTFAATAEVVVWLGATPVFVDVLPDSFNMDPTSLERGIATARQLGLEPRGVMPVDLFGQPADYAAIEAVAEREGLWVLADCAQSFGAEYRGRKAGSIGKLAATSFFPAKPLGCYGDGGAVFTDDADLLAVLRSIRAHGMGEERYEHVRIGMTARLDTIQAAILLEKLAIFPEEIVARQAVADRYAAGLADLSERLTLPAVLPGNSSVWAQYTLVLKDLDRTGFAEALKADGIPTAIHYPRPLTKQPAYSRFPAAGNGVPVAEGLAQSVISLPMHPYLAPADQDRIVDSVRRAATV